MFPDPGCRRSWRVRRNPFKVPNCILIDAKSTVFGIIQAQCDCGLPHIHENVNFLLGVIELIVITTALGHECVVLWMDLPSHMHFASLIRWHMEANNLFLCRSVESLWKWFKRRVIVFRNCGEMDVYKMMQLHVPAIVIHTGYLTRPFLLHYVPTIAATSRAVVGSMRPSCTFSYKIHSWQSSDWRCHCPFPFRFLPLLPRYRNNWPRPMYPVPTHIAQQQQRWHKIKF